MMREDFGSFLANKKEATGECQFLASAARKQGKRSLAIALQDAANIIEAAAFAEAIALPLNRFVTIHFEAGGITDQVKATGKLAKLMGDWLRVNSASFAYVGVRETGEAKGEHVHLLMHVPAALRGRFNRRQPGWIRKMGAARKVRVTYSRPVGRFYYHPGTDAEAREQYLVNLQVAVGYLLKGTDPAALERLGLSRQEAGGELTGKRCFHSENIGRTARKRAGLAF